MCVNIGKVAVFKRKFIFRASISVGRYCDLRSEYVLLMWVYLSLCSFDSFASFLFFVFSLLVDVWYIGISLVALGMHPGTYIAFCDRVSLNV